MGDFGGVIGPTWRESTAWWPPDPEPPAGAPNVVLVVLDDVGYAQLGCYGSDIDDARTSTRLAGGGVRLANFHTTALCSPTRACLLTGRNHHSNGMAPRRRPRRSASPGYNGLIPRENGFLSEILARARLRADRRRQVAPHARGRDALRRAARHVAVRPRLPALVRLPRRRDPPVRAEPVPGQPPRCARPARPTEGYHLTRGPRRPTPSRTSATLRSVEPDAPFFLLLRHRRVPLAAPRARASGSSATAGSSTRAGTRGASATFARQQAMGLLPDGDRARRPARPGCPRGTTSTPEDQQVAARFMECFAAFLSHADAQIGRVLAFVEELGERDNTIVVLVSDNGACAEGGALGSINDARLWNGIPAGRRELRAPHRRDRQPSRAQQLPVGLDDGRQHAVPALEARGARGRRRRSVHRALAARHRRPRRDPARSSRTRSTCCPTMLELVGIDAPTEIDGRRAGTDRRHELRLPARRRRRARAAHHAVLRDARQPRHLPRRVEGGDVQAARPRCTTTASIPTRRSTTTCGSCIDVARRPVARRDDLAAAEPERLAAMVELWWDGGPPLPACSRSTTVRSPRSLAPRRPFHDRDRYGVTGRRRSPVPENGDDQRPRPHPRAPRPRRRARAARRSRACCSRWGRCSAAGRSTCSTAGSGT